MIRSDGSAKVEGAIIVLKAYLGWYEAMVEKNGTPPAHLAGIDVAEQFVQMVAKVGNDNGSGITPSATIH